MSKALLLAAPLLAAACVDEAPKDDTHVELVPPSYQLDGSSRFALATNRPILQAVVTTGTHTRLIDDTLLIDSDVAATSLDGDQVRLFGSVGEYDLYVASASLPQDKHFSVSLDNTVTRIDEVITLGRRCLHAYHGDLEIATEWSVGTARMLPDAANCTMDTPLFIDIHGVELSPDARHINVIHTDVLGIEKAPIKTELDGRASASDQRDPILADFATERLR